MTPEGKRKQKISQFLKTLEPQGLWYCMPPAGPYGKSGIPDYIICLHGAMIGLEVKAGEGTKHPTPKQKNVLNKIAKAGGISMVVNSEETLQIFKDTLLRMLDVWRERRRADTHGHH